MDNFKYVILMLIKLVLFKYKQSLKESIFNSLKDQVKFFTAKDPVNRLITHRKLTIAIVRFLNY